MSAASDGNNAGQSSGQAGEADSLDLDGRQAIEGPRTTTGQRAGRTGR